MWQCLHDKDYKVVLTLAQHGKQGIQSTTRPETHPVPSSSPSSAPLHWARDLGFRAGELLLPTVEWETHAPCQPEELAYFTSYVTLGKCFNLSGPDSPHLQNRRKYLPYGLAITANKITSVKELYKHESTV